MSTTTPTNPINPHDLQTFHTHLASSTRILALLGAGLSASSGLPTFRGPGGLWRTHNPISLATPEAFAANPSLVWQFYSDRRHKALQALPNPAHHALAALARAKPDFLALSQNVDGLSQRAEHTRLSLQLLHGTLFAVHCTTCPYSREDFSDPIVPALASTSDLSDPTTPIPAIPTSSLPTCPNCASLLRPSVVWFGEALPPKVLRRVDDFLNDYAPVDLMLVIGTSATVYPAAGYVEEAAERGAKVCVVNLDPESGEGSDWFFRGDAAAVVPELLGPVIGEV